MIATEPRREIKVKLHSLKRNCQICDCEKADLLFRQDFSGFSTGTLLKGYDVAVCQDCGFAFADDIPDQEEFDSYYEEMSKYEFSQSDGVQSPFDLERFSQILNLLTPQFPVVY